jgi:hypothetical protein
MKIIPLVSFIGALVFFAGCENVKIPTMSAGVGRANYQTSGKLLISARDLMPNHTYGVGIFTTGSPRKIGTLTTDSAGAINNAAVEYPCSVHVADLSVELYDMNGSSLGAGIVQAKTGQATCL